MYRSAKKSDLLDKMTFVQNGIDNVRRTAIMKIDKTNKGGSFVEITATASFDTRKCKSIIHIFFDI